MHNAVPQIELARFLQATLSLFPVVNLIRSRIEFGNNIGRQRVFDHEIPIVLKKLPLFICENSPIGLNSHGNHLLSLTCKHITNKFTTRKHARQAILAI